MAAGKATGLAVAILNDLKVRYLKAYGYRDREKRLRMTVDSIMTAASFTKSTFADAAMHLVEEGVLDLDAPVQRYLSRPLPEYNGYDALRGDDRYTTITIRMLLSHTAGFTTCGSLDKGRIIII